MSDELETSKTASERPQDFSPLHWSGYYDDKQIVETPRGNFCVYKKGSEGPLLVALHGGRCSGLTYALFSKYLLQEVTCQVVAYDQRAHGDTVTENDSDISLDTLASDVGAVISSLYKDAAQLPPIILVGHSMGGAVAIQTSLRKILSTQIALVAIDVTERAAFNALKVMKSYIGGMPSRFQTLEDAIQWSVNSGKIKSIESARVSVIGQVRPIADASLDAEAPKEAYNLPHEWNRDFISLAEPYWTAWFAGLTEKFLRIDVPRLLVIADMNRLDDKLAAACAAGQFDMTVIDDVGHGIQEDAPQKLAMVVAEFLIKNDLTSRQE